MLRGRDPPPVRVLWKLGSRRRVPLRTAVLMERSWRAEAAARARRPVCRQLLRSRIYIKATSELAGGSEGKAELNQRGGSSCQRCGAARARGESRAAVPSIGPAQIKRARLSAS